MRSSTGGTGLLLAVLSAATFGTSGTLRDLADRRRLDARRRRRRPHLASPRWC